MGKLQLVGYCEMKKKKGKVLFVMDEEKKSHIVGFATEQHYVYDDLADKVTPNSIGKHIQLVYGKGYNEKAYVSDLNITD